MREIDYGKVNITISNIVKQQGISINKLACRAELQRSQVRTYIKNEAQRIDLAILARLCYVLECDLSDILEYIPPVENDTTA